jgi:hypothetical protein
VDLMLRHCETRSFKQSVKSFLVERHELATIEDWRKQAVIAVAFFKALHTSRVVDGRTFNEMIGQVS